jgi:hypothetical protein
LYMYVCCCFMQVEYLKKKSRHTTFMHKGEIDKQEYAS